MCPGGFVVPAASGPEQIVVNGMSPSNRGSRWSNSGMVVELRPEDIEQFTIDNLQFTISMQHDSTANCQLPTVNSQLSMMYFQEYLERLCWQQGNMKQTAPAQRMADFTKEKTRVTTCRKLRMHRDWFPHLCTSGCLLSLQNA